VVCHSGSVRQALKYIYLRLIYTIFNQLLYFKIQKLVEKFMYYFICFYLAEVLVVTNSNNYMPICRRAYEKLFIGFNRFFTRLTKYIIGCAGPPVSRDPLDPGLARPMP